MYPDLSHDTVGNDDRHARLVEHLKESDVRQVDERRGVHDAP
jgi:hypothetical protein